MGHPLASRVEALKQRGGIKGCSNSNKLLFVGIGGRVPSKVLFETANKRKSKSEFRCGFLFEEPGGFKGGSPVSSSSSVVKPKTRTFRIAKKGQVAKKNETADDGGGLRVAAPNGPLPQPTPKAHAANCQIKESRKMVSSLARR